MGKVQYIGRNTIFGNPVKKGLSCAVCGKVHSDIDLVLACYRRYLAWRLTPAQEHLGKIASSRCKQMPGKEMGAVEFRKAVLVLDGKVLICPGCGKDAPKCHGRILESAIAWLKKSEVA